MPDAATSPPLAGLADLVRADLALAPNAEARQVLANMLGLSLAAPTRPQRVVPPPLNDEDEDQDETTREPRGDHPLAVDPDDLDPDVVRLEPTQAPTPSTQYRDPIPERQAHHSRPELPFTPLLAERTEAELTILVLSSPSPTSALDIDAAVGQIARARPLLAIPRKTAPAILPGAQVLVDLGEPMQPFRRDQEDFLHRLHQLAGDSAKVLYYRDDPTLEAGPTPRRFGWQPYALPEPGRPLLVLSDLGCGVPRRYEVTRAWLALARRLRRRDSHLVAFGPLEHRQLDSRLRRAVSWVTWDRATTRIDATRLRQELA